MASILHNALLTTRRADGYIAAGNALAATFLQNLPQATLTIPLVPFLPAVQVPVDQSPRREPITRIPPVPRIRSFSIIHPIEAEERPSRILQALDLASPITRIARSTSPNEDPSVIPEPESFIPESPVRSSLDFPDFAITTRRPRSLSDASTIQEDEADISFESNQTAPLAPLSVGSSAASEKPIYQTRERSKSFSFEKNQLQEKAPSIAYSLNELAQEIELGSFSPSLYLPEGPFFSPLGSESSTISETEIDPSFEEFGPLLLPKEIEELEGSASEFDFPYLSPTSATSFEAENVDSIAEKTPIAPSSPRTWTQFFAGFFTWISSLFSSLFNK